MRSTSNSTLTAKTQLESDFSEWRFLISDRRRWWALRGPLSSEQVNEVDTVDADTPEDLRAQLARITSSSRGQGR
ncbi:hypothetical protein [Actinomadura macra]|uniref:hypothetical protein n=1 Tax=Actinomadura macra TaxID=46164 RepID=UPI0008378AD0|nr:hypothetical protein [Actinomadura macra]